MPLFQPVERYSVAGGRTCDFGGSPLTAESGPLVMAVSSPASHPSSSAPRNRSNPAMKRPIASCCLSRRTARRWLSTEWRVLRERQGVARNPPLAVALPAVKNDRHQLEIGVCNRHGITGAMQRQRSPDVVLLPGFGSYQSGGKTSIHEPDEPPFDRCVVARRSEASSVSPASGAIPLTSIVAPNFSTQEYNMRACGTDKRIHPCDAGRPRPRS